MCYSQHFWFTCVLTLENALQPTFCGSHACCLPRYNHDRMFITHALAWWCPVLKPRYQHAAFTMRIFCNQFVDIIFILCWWCTYWLDRVDGVHIDFIIYTLARSCTHWLDHLHIGWIIYTLTCGRRFIIPSSGVARGGAGSGSHLVTPYSLLLCGRAIFFMFGAERNNNPQICPG